MPRVLGINQVNVLSPSFPPEENQVPELGTGIKETPEQWGLLGSTNIPFLFSMLSASLAEAAQS